MAKLDGRCLCGAVTYSADAEPAFTAVCHCRTCQRQTGTSFSIIVGVPEAAFKLEGDYGTFVTEGEDSGKEARRHFCPSCGSPICTLSDGFPGVAIVKAGTLDDVSWLEPQIEVWGRSAQPWIAEAEGRPRLPRGPQAA
jgi:hypothetical protein